MRKGMIKTPEEIASLRKSGALLSRVLGKLVKRTEPGVTTAELDAFAEKEILKAGGRPSFKGYKVPGVTRPFNSSVCISINHEVVHGPAYPSRTVQTGDVLSLDIGMQHPARPAIGGVNGGYFTDMAVTVLVGAVSPVAEKLVRVTRECLERAVAVAVPGGHLSDIGRAVQTHAEKNGFGVVRDLVGHGVGYAVHEDPRVPNYYDSHYPDVMLKEGMVLALEPMITAGNYTVKTLPDQWTVVTTDKSLAAHWEVTVAITKDGAEILTPLPL